MWPSLAESTSVSSPVNPGGLAGSAASSGPRAITWPARGFAATRTPPGEVKVTSVRETRHIAVAR